MGYPTSVGSTARSRAATGLSDRQLLQRSIANSVESWIRDTMRMPFEPTSGSDRAAIESAMKRPLRSGETVLPPPAHSDSFTHTRSGADADTYTGPVKPETWVKFKDPPSVLHEGRWVRADQVPLDARNRATALLGFKKNARPSFDSWALQMGLKLLSELLSDWIALGEGEHAVLPPGTEQALCFAKGTYQGVSQDTGCNIEVPHAGPWEFGSENQWWKVFGQTYWYWHNMIERPEGGVPPHDTHYVRTVVGRWINESPTKPPPIYWEPGEESPRSRGNDDWRMPLDPLTQPVRSAGPDPWPRATPYPLIPKRVPNPMRSPTEQDHRPKPERRPPVPPLFPPVRHEPPPKMTKEEKLLWWQAYLIMRLMLITEINDIIKALYQALPKRRQLEKDYRFTSVSDMYRLVYKYWREINWETATANLLINHIEDLMIGRFEGGRQKLLQKHALGPKTPHGDAQRNPLTPEYQQYVSRFVDDYIAPRVREVVHAYWTEWSRLGKHF